MLLLSMKDFKNIELIILKIILQYLNNIVNKLKISEEFLKFPIKKRL